MNYSVLYTIGRQALSDTLKEVIARYRTYTLQDILIDQTTDATKVYMPYKTAYCADSFNGIAEVCLVADVFAKASELMAA